MRQSARPRDSASIVAALPWCARRLRCWNVEETGEPAALRLGESFLIRVCVDDFELIAAYVIAARDQY